MTLYLPGPWEIEILYVDGGLTHIARYNCDMNVAASVGDPMSAFIVERRAATPTAADLIITNWVTLIKPLFSTTTNFTTANLYKYNVGTMSKVFYASYTIGQVGTGAGAFQPTQELILTFRSQLGNPIRLSFLEIVTDSRVRQPIDDAPANVQAIADFTTGVQSWILARDGSYPVGQLNACYGKNDALERQRYR
jgi:hypothetical protein